MPDEILVKGQDGKWYILRGEEFLPYGESRSKQPEAGVVDLPKGVPAEVHERMEQKTETLPALRPPSSIISPPIVHAEHPLFQELEELVDRVIAQSGISFSDPVLQKRLRTLVSSRLRDVRDTLEARAILARASKVGGIGLRDDEQLKVEEQMEKAVAEFQAKWRAVEDQKIAEWKKKKQEKQEQPHPTERPAQVETLLRTPRTEEAIKTKVGLREGCPQDLSSRHAPPQDTQPRPIPPRYIPIRSVEKIRDVRPAPKLLGPLQELQTLTLNELRLLGEAGSAKILDKIERLGQESLAQKRAAMQAWQASPIMQLLQTLLRSALEKGLPIEEYLQLRTKEGKDTLTKGEFHAIMELNKKLRL